MTASRFSFRSVIGVRPPRPHIDHRDGRPTTVAGTTTSIAAGGATTTTIPTLPETGGDVNARLAVLALAFVGIGAAAIATTRRRPVV